MKYYNGFTEGQIGGAEGLIKLGIEKIKPIITRGILLDIAANRGDMNAGDIITLADVNNALTAQGLDSDAIQPGDAILFRTNWGRHWIIDNDTYNSGAPGIGMEVADWLVSKEVVLVGSDTWPVEVVPNPDGLAFPVHQKLITDNGIFIHENLNLEELVSDGVYQFAYIFVRVPIKGATGSPGSPIAVH
jgi:kynurenine formamidase